MYGLKDYVAPVDNMRITSGEGSRKASRTTNGARMSSFHHGVDIAGAKPGSKPPIKNITGGKVVWVGNAGGWGKTVIVENPDGYRVQYGHLDSIAVKVGDQIPAGGKIGIMGATGNVTGVHLDMIVTKDGKSLKRDGSVLADAPASIAKRAGGKVPSGQVDVMGSQTQSASNQAQVPSIQSPMFVGMASSTPQAVQNTQHAPMNLFGGVNDMFGGGSVNLLQGATGIAVPETPTENQLFGGIANMGLNSTLEQIYAEAARAIAGAKDNIESQPIIQSNNPLRAELGAIFDKIEV